MAERGGGSVRICANILDLPRCGPPFMCLTSPSLPHFPAVVLPNLFTTGARGRIVARVRRVG
eukprot:3729880-Prymnesium_polylepis.1